MKKYSKYHFSALLLMLATGLASVSCADEDIAKDQENNGKSNFSFSVTDVQDAPDADLPSRATDAETYLTRSIDFNEAGTADMCLQESTIPGVNPMKRTPQTRAWLKASIDANFGAFACKNGSAGPDFFYNEEVNRHGQMVNPISWSRSAATLKFYAVYPYMDGTNTRQKLVQATTGSLPYVEFEASTDIANQTDLMTAETATINYTATGGSPHVVPLKFYHALTAIRFGIGSNLSWNKTIKSIEFRGIKNAGRFDLATKAWSHQSGTQNFKLDNLSQSTSGTLNTVIVKDGNTFLMVPQTLPAGAKIVITFTDNSQITANIGGKVWAAGTTKTYMMTERNSNWDYQLQTTNPVDIAYDQTQSTTPYTIKSYRQAPGGVKQEAVAWRVIAYQESTDNGATWSAESQTKPAWLTNLTTVSGDGGTAAESGTATVKIDVTDHLVAYNAVLQTAIPKGSAGNYHDLSMHNYKGVPTAQRNTANSYLISAPGWYKIPLVYGNAITNGQNNSHAYISQAPTGTPNEQFVLRTFKDHNEADITSPYINVQNSAAPATQAAIVWTDQSGIVEASSLGIEGSGTNAFVHFHVPQDKIKNGNAVIAVKNASGTIMWSWHLWFAHKEVLETVKCTNFQNVDYYFTKQTLGFAYRKWEGTTYDKPRVARVKVEQTIANNGAKQFAYIDIKQNPSSVLKEISTTYYQFGRKDAMPGVQTISDGSFTENGGNNMSIRNGIQHPEIYYTWGTRWFNVPPSGYSYNNLWSMDNTTTGCNDNSVVKTIYDPCPAGFKMPAGNAFTGFTTTGNESTIPSEWNVSGDWDYGRNFNNKLINPDAIVYFPAFGFRYYNIGSLFHVGNAGYYWSAAPQNPYTAYMLRFFRPSVSPQYSGQRSYGYSARPVAEQ